MGITTENLKVGMEVKNYKTLCELMGIPERANATSTSSRKATMKDIECYIDYEKHGQKFCISEIYEEPLEKVDKRLEGLHTKYLNIIVCAYLLSRSENINEDVCNYNTPITNWLKVVGLCNNNYRNNITITQLYANAPYHMTKKELEEFYYKKNNKLKRYLTTSLEQLKDRRLIIYSDRTMLCYDETTRLADDEEEIDIMKAERRILSKLNLNSMFQMKVRGLSNEFYEDVKEELRVNELQDYNDFSGLRYYYKVIDVTFVKSLMIKELEKMIREYKEDLSNVLSIVIKENNIATVNSCEKSNEKKYPTPKIGHLLSGDERKKELEKYLIDQLIALDNDEIKRIISRSYSYSQKNDSIV